MPARNAASTIKKAVGSTLRALPADSELLIHDDASSDDTAQIIDTFTDRRVKLYRSDTSKGVAGGLNYLLNISDSRFVGRMDADDICLPWRFRISRSALSNELTFLFMGVVHFGDQIRPTAPIRLSPESLRATLLLENPFAHPTFFGERSGLARVGYYHECAAEDYELWLRLAASGENGIRTATPGILYRNHAGQTSRKLDWRASALDEDSFRASYINFVQTVFGVEPVWLDQLITLEESGDRHSWNSLAELIEETRQQLPRAEGESLRRRFTRLESSRTRA